MPSIVSAVVVHHKNPERTLESIDSVLASEYPRLNVIVVDCAFPGQTIPAELSEKGVTVIRAFPDPGPSSARNIGIRRGLVESAEYVLLFDSDVLLRSECLPILVDRASGSCGIGAVQPKVLSRQDPHRLDTIGQRLTRNGAYDLGIGDPDGPSYAKPQTIFGVSSAAALYSTRALRESGLFDEDIQFMFEDVDLSWRIRLAGYTCVYEPAAVAYHLRSSTRPGIQSLHRRSYQWRNWLMISTRYFPADVLTRAFPQEIAHALMAFLIESLTGRGGKFSTALVRGEARSILMRRRLRHLLETDENRKFIGG
jgi:hypothetical protein